MNVKILGLLCACLLVALPVRGQTMGTPVGTAATSGGGAFDSLPAGNQKIADALFAAQHPTGTQTRLSRDQIATMKDGEGWGNVFKQMKADGLVTAKNLGQVVSAHEHALHAAQPGAVPSMAGASGHSGTAAGTMRGSTFGSASAAHGRASAAGPPRGSATGSGTQRGVATHGYAYGYGPGWSGHGMPAGGPYGHAAMGGGFAGGVAGGGFAAGHGGPHGR